VSQFGDPYATQKVLSDPVLAHWIVQSGQSALFDYLVTHPWSTVSAPLAAIPEVMTMNPDYAPGPGLPSWASTIVYGNFPVLGTAFTGGGAGSSADPAYLDVLLALAAVVFIGAALRRRMTAPVWVSAIALAFMAVWAIETWSLCGTELPRIIIPSAILIHLALVVLVASGIDALVSAPTTANPGAHFGQRGGTRSVLARIRRGASRPVPPPPAGAA
jgi:hypothetical protein